jgi:hypothetical protein
MYSKDPSTHIAEALIRSTEHSRSHPHPQAQRPEVPEQPLFTIAFSREAGSGGTTVGHEVGRRLNWPVYDQELLEKLSQDLQVDVHWLEELDEKPGSWLVESIKAFAAVSTISEVTYFRRLLNTILALGARGECIIVGRGSPFVLPVETTLRVRLVAASNDRIAFLSRERGLSPTEAARFVDTTDRERLRFIKDHFHKDLTNPLNYDLILNTSRFSLDETAELVIEGLQRLQARKVPVKSPREQAARSAAPEFFK